MNSLGRLQRLNFSSRESWVPELGLHVRARCERFALKGRGAGLRQTLTARLVGDSCAPPATSGGCLLPRKLSTPLTPRFESTGRSIPPWASPTSVD